jgi:uncharacterized protein (DUF2147 family)
MDRNDRSRRRGRALAAAVLAVAGLAGWLAPAGGTGAAEGADISGRWMVEKKDAIIVIEPRGAGLAGRVDWAKDRDGIPGDERLDTKNPSPELRTRKVLGLDILTGLPAAPDDEGWYRRGRIYNPKTGKSYPVRVRRESADRLRLRVGGSVVGQTTYWTRVD